MKITGRLDTYECSWEVAGFSYAKVNIYKQVPYKKFFMFSATKLVKVWSSSGPKSPYLYGRMEKMHPEGLRKRYQECVKEYEDYAEAWDKECENG